MVFFLPCTHVSMCYQISTCFQLNKTYDDCLLLSTDKTYDFRFSKTVKIAMETAKNVKNNQNTQI